MTYSFVEQRLLSGLLTSEISLIILELGLLLLKVSDGIEEHGQVLLEECIGREVERGERGLD